MGNFKQTYFSLIFNPQNLQFYDFKRLSDVFKEKPELVLSCNWDKIDGRTWVDLLVELDRKSVV